MARTDYYHEEGAPSANSLVPAASVVAVDAEGKILLHKRSDSGYWSIPGGKQEPGETIKQTAVRETREETGYEVELDRLVGIFSDPGHVVAYSDGEVRQEFSVCFAGRVVAGAVVLSEESEAVGFFSPAEMQEMTIHEGIRSRIEMYLEARPEPFVL